MATAPPNIETLLRHTLDPAHAKEAGDVLDATLRSHPDATLSALFSIATAAPGTQDAGVQQAAVLQAKNAVVRHWNTEASRTRDIDDQLQDASPVVFGEAVRAQVRAGIIAACVSSTPAFQVHLLLTFGAVAKLDFPSRWPGMLEEIMACVQDGQNPGRMVVGLRLLLQLLKTYEFRTIATAAEGETGGANIQSQIVEAVFPALLGIGNALVNHDDPQAQSVLHLVTKSFYSAVTSGEMPIYFLKPETFNAWATLLASVVMRPVPEAHLKVEEGESSTMTIFWRPKKWACTAVLRLYVRYGNPKAHESMLSKNMNPEEKAVRKAFSQSFSATYGSKFLDMMLAHVLSASQGAYAPPRFRNVCLNFVDTCLQEQKLRKIIKPNAEELMFKAIPHLLALTPEDIELFEDDPEEYTRRCNDFVEEYSSARAAAQTLWVDLCQAYGVLRSRAIEWTAQILEHTAAQPSTGANGDPAVITAETAFNALEVLENQLTKKNQAVMVEIVRHHALPRVTGAPGVLKSRICKFLGTYSSLPFGEPQTVVAITEALLMAIQPENALPVRVQACEALSVVLANCEDDEATGTGPKAVVRPNLRPLLDVLFALIDAIESDVLVQTVEVVAGVFENEIGPYAVELVSKLAATFTKISSDDENAAFAAQQCLGTICTVVNAVSELKDLFPHLITVLGPLLQHMISPEGIDFFEETMEILTVLSYHCPEIPDAMLDLFPLLHAAYNDWAVDYIEDMEAPIDNLLTRATSRFASRPGYVDMVLDICVKCVDAEQSPQSAIVATNIFEPVAQATKGLPYSGSSGAAAGAQCPDPFVTLFIPALITRIHAAQNPDGTPRLLRNKNLQIHAMRAVGNAFYANPALSAQVLQQHGMLPSVLSLWAKCTPKFRGYHCRKVCAIGLLSALSLGSHAPAAIVEARTQMARAAFAMVEKLAPVKAERERLKAEEAAGGRRANGDDEGDDEDDAKWDHYDVDEDPDDADRADDDADYLRMLQRHARLALTGELDEDDEEESSEDEEEEEDLTYMAAIDAVDEHVAARGLIETLQAQHPEFYQGMMQGMAQEDVALIQRVCAAAPAQ